MKINFIYASKLLLLLFLILVPTVYSINFSADSTHITYDTYIDSGIDSLGEIDIYTFNGQAGDRIILRMRQYGTDPFDRAVFMYTEK